MLLPKDHTVSFTNGFKNAVYFFTQMIYFRKKEYPCLVMFLNGHYWDITPGKCYVTIPFLLWNDDFCNTPCTITLRHNSVDTYLKKNNDVMAKSHKSSPVVMFPLFSDSTLAHLIYFGKFYNFWNLVEADKYSRLSGEYNMNFWSVFWISYLFFIWL